SLLDWLLRTRAEIEILSYLDGDLYFFSDPEPIFESFKAFSSLVIAHRFHPRRKFMEVYGLYNVGWLSFRRDTDGLACLAWWRDRCIEWCYDFVEADRYADQKYLNQFPLLFGNLKIIEHKGANLAAWNLRNYRL